MSELRIIKPPVATSSLELDLVDLTTRLIRGGHAERCGGVLGGEFGYGAEFQNDVFEMRPYYWGDCTCGADVDQEEPCAPHCATALPNFKHYRSGLEIRWYKWIGRGMEYNTALREEVWQEIIAECRASIPPATADPLPARA